MMGRHESESEVHIRQIPGGRSARSLVTSRLSQQASVTRASQIARTA